MTERSDLVEEYHDGAVAVADRSGDILAAYGDIDRPFFIRSAGKPFQAHAGVEAGLDLPPVHLAVACSSHSGDPVHIALVKDILRRHGLSEADLRCPPARPFLEADRRLARAGDLDRRSLYHNCSGKHAAMLAACSVKGWDTSSYLEPEHPLQVEVGRLIGEVTGDEVHPPGVDGCGLPVWRVTTRGLARAYARLANEPRFEAVRTAMTRYPMLVSGEGRADGLIARWTGGAVKGGAAGCMGAAVAGRGFASKAWTGSGAVAGVGVTFALMGMGMMTRALDSGLREVSRPAVLGGGKEVGRIRPTGLLETV